MYLNFGVLDGKIFRTLRFYGVSWRRHVRFCYTVTQELGVPAVYGNKTFIHIILTFESHRLLFWFVMQ